MNSSYIAGFFDGEGCVSAYCSGGKQMAQVRLTISQRKSEVLYEIQDYLGYGRMLPHSSRASTTLTINSKEEVMNFIRLIYPHSVVKREQLRLAYQLASLVGTKERDKRQALHDAIRERP